MMMQLEDGEVFEKNAYGIDINKYNYKDYNKLKPVKSFNNIP